MDLCMRFVYAILYFPLGLVSGASGNTAVLRFVVLLAFFSPADEVNYFR
jgi:hypothetical protein